MTAPRTLLLLYPGAVRSRRELMGRHRDGLRTRGVRVVLADDWIDVDDAAHFDAVVQIPPPERVGEVVEALAQSEAAIELERLSSSTSFAISFSASGYLP